jgi:hypothetical protein
MWRVGSNWSYDDADADMLIFSHRPASSLSSKYSAASCRTSPAASRRDKKRSFDYWRRRAYFYFLGQLNFKGFELWNKSKISQSYHLILYVLIWLFLGSLGKETITRKSSVPSALISSAPLISATVGDQLTSQMCKFEILVGMSNFKFYRLCKNSRNF